MTDNINGTQSCMCCEATHAAEKVSSWRWLWKGKDASNFYFFCISWTTIYCIWSGTREQNFNDPLGYNGSQFLIKSMFTYPNDLPMTSDSLYFGCFFYVPFFLNWVVLVWSMRWEPNASFQERENPIPLLPKKALVWSYLLLDLSITALIKEKVHTWGGASQKFTPNPNEIF